jgi:hypothetical protein
LQYILRTVFQATEVEPDASVNMAGVDDPENENHKSNQVVLSLLGVLGEKALHKESTRLVNPVDMHESKQLEEVKLSALTKEDVGHRGNHVKKEVSLKVVWNDVR